MRVYAAIFSLGLVSLVTVACDSASSAPPSTSKNKSANIDKNASGGDDKSKLNDKDPLSAFFDNGDEKTPGELRENQIYNLQSKADRLNSLANDYRGKCFNMSTSIITRDTKNLLPAGTKTGAGAAVAGIGQIGVGVLGGGLSGNWAQSISGVGSAVGKSFGEGVSAEVNKAEIKADINYINSLEAQDMATCEATVKNLKAQAAVMYRQINDLRNLGTE